MNNKNSIEENRELFIKAYKEKNFFKASFLGEELIEQHKKTEKINSYEYCVDLYNVAFFYQKTGNLFKACKFHHENIEFFSNIKKFKENTYSKEYAEIFIDILTSNGICHAKNQELKTSLKNFEKAYKIANDHLRESNKYIDCLHNLGCAYYNIKKYDKAIELYLKILEIKDKKDLNYADTLNFLGYCYEEKEEYNKALYYFDNALSIIKGLEGISSKDYLSNIYYIAGIYEEAKDYTNAIKYFEKAINLIESKYGEKSSHISETLNRIANIYLKLKEEDKAVSIILKSLNLIRNSYGENHIFYTNNLKKIADIYFNIKDYKNALNYYKQEAELKKKIAGEDNSLYIETLINLVKVNYKLKNFEDVNLICEKIFRLKELEVKDDIYEKALLLLSKIFIKDKTDDINKIYENMKKINPDMKLDEMIEKAKSSTDRIVQEFYIPKDEKNSLHNIEEEILTDLKNFLEKNLLAFSKKNTDQKETFEKQKVEEENIEKSIEESIEKINKTDKIEKIEEKNSFNENSYTQENILDLLHNKNDDEDPEILI